jgi:hypothetical protein
MTPETLVAALEARGVTLVADGPELVVKPATRVFPEELAALKAVKAEVLALLRGRQTISLYRLTETLVVEVPGLGGPLYITPSCREAEALRAKAPKPSVVFCRCRLIDLILAGATKAEARAVLETALLFDGSITGVRVQ